MSWQRRSLLSIGGSVIGITAALLSTSCVAAAPPTAPSCAWADSSTGGSGGLWPDSDAQYWTTPFTLQSGLKITVQGKFSDARYESFTAYNGLGSPFTTNGRSSSIPDYQIQPEPGSQNPWQQNALPGGSFTLTFDQVAAGGNDRPLAPSTAANGAAGYLMYRIYLPDSQVQLPTLTFSNSSGSVTIQPCVQAFSTKSSTDGIVSTAALASTIGTPGFTNPDNFYSTTYPSSPPSGYVDVVKAKAPTFPNSDTPQVWPGSGQVRYWSLCTYTTSTVVIGCKHDSEIPLVAGSYAVVLGLPAQQGAIEAAGAAYLQYGGSLLLRNMMANFTAGAYQPTVTTCALAQLLSCL